MVANISEVPGSDFYVGATDLEGQGIVCVVPDARKPRGQTVLRWRDQPMAPASILRTHSAATIYLDRASARCSVLDDQRADRLA